MESVVYMNNKTIRVYVSHSVNKQQQQKKNAPDFSKKNELLLTENGRSGTREDYRSKQGSKQVSKKGSPCVNDIDH